MGALGLTLGLLQGAVGGPPPSDELVWYVFKSGGIERTDGANALYEAAHRAARRRPAGTPNT